MLVLGPATQSRLYLRLVTTSWMSTQTRAACRILSRMILNADIIKRLKADRDRPALQTRIAPTSTAADDLCGIRIRRHRYKIQLVPDLPRLLRRESDLLMRTEIRVIPTPARHNKLMASLRIYLEARTARNRVLPEQVVRSSAMSRPCMSSRRVTISGASPRNCTAQVAIIWRWPVSTEDEFRIPERCVPE